MCVADVSRDALRVSWARAPEGARATRPRTTAATTDDADLIMTAPPWRRDGDYWGAPTTPPTALCRDVRRPRPIRQARGKIGFTTEARRTRRRAPPSLLRVL